MPNETWLFRGDRDSQSDQIRDYEFGTWVKNRRHEMSLTHHETAQIGGMEPYRWLAIERGGIKKAATRAECIVIAKVFDLPVEAVIKKAVGE